MYVCSFLLDLPFEFPLLTNYSFIQPLFHTFCLYAFFFAFFWFAHQLKNLFSSRCAFLNSFQVSLFIHAFIPVNKYFTHIYACTYIYIFTHSTCIVYIIVFPLIRFYTFILLMHANALFINEQIKGNGVIHGWKTII